MTDTVTTDRDTPSEYRFFNGPFLTVPFLRKCIDAYIPNPDDRTSELATARNISAKNAAKQPPTLILNSSADLLRDEGVFYGEILQKAGVDVAIMTSHGQLHDSVLFEAVRAGATPRAALRLIAAQLKMALKETGEIKVAAKGRGKRLRDGLSEENTDQPTKKDVRRRKR